MTSSVCGESVLRRSLVASRSLGVVVEDVDRSHRHRPQGDRADDEMEPHDVPRLAADPVPAADQHHAQVEHDGGDHHEVDDARQADDPAAELLELAAQAPMLDDHRPGIGNRRHHVGIPGQDHQPVQHRAEDIGHGQVPREERGHHADRQHRQSQEPVAEIVRRGKAPCRGRRARTERGSWRPPRRPATRCRWRRRRSTCRARFPGRPPGWSTATRRFPGGSRRPTRPS